MFFRSLFRQLCSSIGRARVLFFAGRARALSVRLPALQKKEMNRAAARCFDRRRCREWAGGKNPGAVPPVAPFHKRASMIATRRETEYQRASDFFARLLPPYFFFFSRKCSSTRSDFGFAGGARFRAVAPRNPSCLHTPYKLSAAGVIRHVLSGVRDVLAISRSSPYFLHIPSHLHSWVSWTTPPRTPPFHARAAQSARPGDFPTPKHHMTFHQRQRIGQRADGKIKLITLSLSTISVRSAPIFLRERIVGRCSKENFLVPLRILLLLLLALARNRVRCRTFRCFIPFVLPLLAS